MAVFLLLVSTSLLARPPEGVNPPGLCDDPPCGRQNANTLSSSTASIPEPSTLALMCLGATGLVFARRRKR
jgi:hypothetical protein